MWSNADRIGCGASTCPGGITFVACNYGGKDPMRGAGNLNPPQPGGKYSTSKVPIKCGVTCPCSSVDTQRSTSRVAEFRVGKALRKS